MDYRGVFCCKKFFCFRAEEFIFMVNFDEIEFLESEIVEDDPQAPVGTLVHILEDGTVEIVDTQKEQNTDFATPVQDVADAHTDEQSEQVANADEEVNENVVEQPVDEEVAQETVKDEAEPVENVADVQENVSEENADEPQEDVTDVEENVVEEENAPQVEEGVHDAENAQSYIEETTVDVDDYAEVNEEATSPVENTEPTVEEPADEQLVEKVEEPVSETPVETEENASANESAVEEENAVETAPADELVVAVNDEEQPQTEQEVVAENSESVEVASEPETAVATEVVAEEKTETVVAPKKPRKKTVKKEESEVAPVEPEVENKTSINLKNGRNVNEALFDTSFQIEKPEKAKVVSTKKKQEKAEDLWAVATVTAKPTKSTAKTKAVNAENAEVAAKTTEIKSASKKSTKVENTSKISTEEKKVAKTTKTDVKETKTDVKETKTEVKNAKAAKAPAKEEKAPKAKAVEKAEVAPAKETKATKTAAKTDSDETVIVEGEGKTHGKYVIKKTDKGNFVFKLYSSNYRVVAIGAQAYTTLGAAKIGIQSIINNAEKAPVENQTLKNYETLKFPKWEIYLDKKGEYRLRLYATNGSLIATTNDGYTDISGAKNGIAAVGRANKGCAIVRNDNLW